MLESGEPMDLVGDPPRDFADLILGKEILLIGLRF